MSRFSEDDECYERKMRKQGEKATAAMAAAFARLEEELKPIPVPVIISSPEEDALDTKIKEKEAEIDRLCREIESMRVPLGPFYGQRIARAVAAAHNIKFNELISQRRQRHLVIARQHAMWALKEHTALSLPAIGRILGNRNHSTIMYGIRAHLARVGNA